MSKVRVAVIGCGFLGKWHVDKARSLENAELVAIVDPISKQAETLYPDIRLVSDLSEVISEIDAAIIATPTSTHFNLCQQLLSSGKHVFVEKPMTSTLAEAEQLKTVMAGQDLVLQVGHSERFHLIWERLGEFEEFLRSPTLIRINRQAPFKGRATDVDVIQDLMIHDLDLLLYLFPEAPILVESVGDRIRTDKWDCVTSIFSYKNGPKAILTVGRNYVVEERFLEVNSSAGTICFDLLRNKVFRSPNSGEEYVLEENYPKSDHLLREQEKFYAAILNKTPAPVTFSDGHKAVRLIELVRKSLELGKPVEL